MAGGDAEKAISSCFFGEGDAHGLKQVSPPFVENPCEKKCNRARKDEKGPLVGWSEEGIFCQFYETARE